VKGKPLSLFVIFILAISLFAGGCGVNESIAKSETLVSTLDINASEPAIASDANGNIYVVYVEHSADKTADVYLQKFDGDLKPNGEKLRVNPEKGTAKAWRGDPPTVKIGNDGAIFIGWTAKFATQANQSATDLMLSVSRDSGKTFDAPIKVNDDILPASHGMHSLEIGRDNRVFMAWLDERNIKPEKQAKNSEDAEIVNQSDSQFQFVKIHHNDSNRENKNVGNQTKSGEMNMKNEAIEPNSEVFFAVSSDGGKTFSANKKLSSEVCPCCKTNLLAAPDGKIYASWRQVVGDNFRHIAVAESSDNGVNFSKPTIVSDDKWQLNACPVSGAPMAVDKNNALKIVWFTAGAAGALGIYSAESKDNGKSFAPRVLVSDKGASGTPVILPNAKKEFSVVFSSTDGNTYFLTKQYDSADFTEQNEIRDADLPGAAISKDKTFIVFVKKIDNGKQVFFRGP
jgi:hypothetical protein